MEGDSPTFNVPYIHTLGRYQKSCTTEFYAAVWKKKKKNSFVPVTKMLLLNRSGSSEWCLCVSLSPPPPPPPPPLPHCPPCLLRSLWADSCVAAVGFTDVQLYSDCALTSAFQPPPPNTAPIRQPLQIQSLSPITPQVMSLL